MRRAALAFFLVLVTLPLLLLGTGCQHPAYHAAPTISDVPGVPESAPSILGPVPVIWVDSLLDGQGRVLLGGYQPLERRIYLVNALKDTPAVALQVFLHEYCHVALHDAGIPRLLPRELADTICDAVATHQAALQLRR